MKSVNSHSEIGWKLINGNEISRENNFDLIVCRNVVIYFNNDIKQEIYEKFSRSLKKGGLLFVGATESIYNYREYGFEKASTFIYKKV